MIVIQSYSTQNSFLINGKTYPKNFIIIKQGDENISIHNAYDTSFQLLPSTHFSQIQVNGIVYSSQSELMSSLSNLLFIKQFNYVTQDSQLTRLISVSGVTITGNTLTVQPSSWLINGVEYSTSSNTIINVPFTSSGSTRIDIIVGNTSGQIQRVQGTPTAGIALQPITPVDSVFVTQLLVSNTTINYTVPIVGETFVKKLEFQENFTNSSGNIVIDLINESTAFRLSGSIVSVRGFNATSTFFNTAYYTGKEVKIVNTQNTPITLKHYDSGNVKMTFPTSTDFVLNSKEVAIFKLVKTTEILAEFVSVSRVSTSVNQTLQDVMENDSTTIYPFLLLDMDGSGQSTIQLFNDEENVGIVSVFNHQNNTYGRLLSNRINFQGNNGSEDYNLWLHPNKSKPYGDYTIATLDDLSGSTVDLTGYIPFTGGTKDLVLSANTITSSGLNLPTTAQGYLNVYKSSIYDIFDFYSDGIDEGVGNLRMLLNGEEGFNILSTDNSISPNFNSLFNVGYLGITSTFYSGTSFNQFTVDSNKLYVSKSIESDLMVKAPIISGTTYLNLPKDIYTTGATKSGNTITLLNNTGGTINLPTISELTDFQIRNGGYLFFDDFFNVSVNYPFARTFLSSGSGGLTNISNGVYRINSSTTANSGGNILFQNSSAISPIGLTNGLKYDVYIAFPTLDSLTTTRLGLLTGTNTQTDATNGMYFELTGSTVIGKTASSSVRSTTSGFSLSVNTYYHFRITYLVTSVQYEIYSSTGVLLWSSSLTTNIPSVTLGGGLITTNSGTTQRTLVDVDYIGITIPPLNRGALN